MYTNTAADRSFFAKDLKRIHKEKIRGVEADTVVFYNQGSCAIFMAGYGPFTVYSTCDGGITLVKAGAAVGRLAADSIWKGALRQIPQEAWVETDPDAEDETYFRRMELHLLPPDDPFEDMLTAEDPFWDSTQDEQSLQSERTRYKGLEIEGPVQLGKGRKFQVYSPEDNFKKPFKTVDSLAAAKAYIDEVMRGY